MVSHIWMGDKAVEGLSTLHSLDLLYKKHRPVTILGIILWPISSNLVIGDKYDFLIRWALLK